MCRPMKDDTASSLPGTETERVIGEDEALNCVLAAIKEQDCRKILEKTADETLTASELSEACSIPLSTVYRKVERLTDAGLLNEQIRPAASGKPMNEYTHDLTDISLSIDHEDGVSLRLSLCEDADTTTSLFAGRSFPKHR